ncbi:MAG: hypothetical protein LBN93_05470 [Candidatus Symbiothrix sp.]|jgi:chromosome segregation ATPase|nr:hypothetical protein [Candidatus Symbiothrix sp.]
MKKITSFLATMAVVLLLVGTSCVSKSHYNKLEAERDSLALINDKANAEMDKVLELLNEVEDNFDSMKSAENYLTIQSSGDGGLTATTKERIHGDMQFIAETLTKNKAQIEELEKKLKTFSGKSTELQKTVDRLKSQLDAKTSELAVLKQELEKKNRLIEDLTYNNKDLQADVQTLERETNKQTSTILRQQTEISKVYYCFGTSKELKDQKIVVGGELGTDFKNDYFIAADKNALKKIPLLAKSGKLISKHPTGSYEFAKAPDGKAELRITNAAQFWSLTKYLVIEVKV